MLQKYLAPIIAALALALSLWTATNTGGHLEKIDRRLDTIQSELQSIRTPMSQAEAVRFDSRLARLESNVEMLNSPAYQRTQFERNMETTLDVMRNNQQQRLARSQ